MENFNSAITTLDSLAKIYDIFVPSLNKKIKFKGLTTKQQKDAVKCALDKNLAGVVFSNLINSIISENSIEKNSYLLPDRNYIIACLRVLSLSKTFQTEDGEKDLSFITSFNTPLPENLKNKEISEDGITLKLSIPSLEKDTFVNNETRKKLAPLPDDDNFAKESIGEVFVNELVKYVDVFSITTPQPLTLNLNDLTFNQKVQLIEKLPLNLNTKLVDYINETKAFEKKYFTLNNQELDISIDPTLFTV